MTVAQLIAILSSCSPDAQIQFADGLALAQVSEVQEDNIVYLSDIEQS